MSTESKDVPEEYILLTHKGITTTNEKPPHPETFYTGLYLEEHGKEIEIHATSIIGINLTLEGNPNNVLSNQITIAKVILKFAPKARIYGYIWEPENGRYSRFRFTKRRRMVEVETLGWVENIRQGGNDADGCGS